MKKLDIVTLESLLSHAPAASDKSTLHSILSWSADRPVWLRDALRRIISKGVLDQIDHQELENIFRNGTQAVDALQIALAYVGVKVLNDMIVAGMGVTSLAESGVVSIS